MSFQIQFGDVVFYQWLLSLGLTPNKSKTIGPLKIPYEYFFDFLRGFLTAMEAFTAILAPSGKPVMLFI